MRKKTKKITATEEGSKDGQFFKEKTYLACHKCILTVLKTAKV